MFNLKVFPYKMGSDSAKQIADLLGCVRVRDNGRYVPKANQTILNWGNGRAPGWYGLAQRRGVRLINSFDAVSRASNKLTTLNYLKNRGISTPTFTTDINEARRWLAEGASVVERHDLHGHSGKGIRIVDLNDYAVESNVTHAPLYTKFINKNAEYRVHVFNGKVIDFIQKKRVRQEDRKENYSPYISSLERGWVFVRTDVPIMPGVSDLAVNAVKALGLDFGAVDIVSYEGRSYVLEVNTAPGLAGTTLVKYGSAIRHQMGLSSLSESISRPTIIAPRAPVAAYQAQVNRIPEVYVNVRMTNDQVRQLAPLLRNYGITI